MADVRALGWAGAFAAVFLGGCEDKAKSVAAPPAPAAAIASTPSPPFSVNEMMVMIVDQPGELLWDVEKSGRAPKSAEDWYQLENHAASLAAAATVIQLGGSGPNDKVWAADPLWRTSAEKLTSAALLARGAARAKDLPTLISANGQIVDACEACHSKFKPDIPTGGLFIHKRPGVDR